MLLVNATKIEDTLLLMPGTICRALCSMRQFKKSLTCKHQFNTLVTVFRSLSRENKLSIKGFNLRPRAFNL